MTSYRANAIPTCACGARLPDAPLLSPATGDPVCGACHAKDLRDGGELAGAQSRPGEALRHLAMSLAAPKGDPLLARRSVCRACGGITRVASVREHIEAFALLFGTTYRHVCERCSVELRTESLWATFGRSLGAMVMLAIAWVCWFMSGTMNNALAAVFALLGGALVAQRVVRVRDRWFAPKKLRR